MMKIIFMGTPDFSVTCLNALVEAGHDIVCAYSQPPRKSGRGQKLRPSPVQARAEELGIPTRHPTSLKNVEAQEEFARFNADIAVVVAYGLLLPNAILEAPKFGCLNIHASLLPRWRGAAPIQRTIMAGDSETGVTIMQMDEGLDAGDMLIEDRIAITENMNAGMLHDALAVMGGNLIIKCLVMVEKGGLQPVKQPEDGVTYAEKLRKEEGLIRWDQPATVIDRTIRGLNPWPGCWFEYEGERIKILEGRMIAETGSLAEVGETVDQEMMIQCAQGQYQPTKLQRAGKKPVDLKAFLNGLSLPAGTQLM